MAEMSESSPDISNIMNDSTLSSTSANEFDLSISDQGEAERVEEFFSETCGCKLGPKSTPCSSLLCRELLVTRRNDCIQLESSELDLVILAQLQALRAHSDQPLTEHLSSTPHRSYTVFYFQKLRICLKTFLFVHGISHKCFEALQKHFDCAGLVPRIHGNTKRLPKNTRPKQDTFRALGFIDNMSEIHGLPLPGRMPNHRALDCF